MIIAGFLLACPAPARGDRIILKSGKVIEGKIIRDEIDRICLFMHNREKAYCVDRNKVESYRREFPAPTTAQESKPRPRRRVRRRDSTLEKAWPVLLPLGTIDANAEVDVTTNSATDEDENGQWLMEIEAGAGFGVGDIELSTPVMQGGGEDGESGFIAGGPLSVTFTFQLPTRGGGVFSARKKREPPRHGFFVGFAYGFRDQYPEKSVSAGFGGKFDIPERHPKANLNYVAGYEYDFTEENASMHLLGTGIVIAYDMGQGFVPHALLGPGIGRVTAKDTVSDVDLKITGNILIVLTEFGLTYFPAEKFYLVGKLNVLGIAKTDVSVNATYTGTGESPSLTSLVDRAKELEGTEVKPFTSLSIGVGYRF